MTSTTPTATTDETPLLSSSSPPRPFLLFWKADRTSPTVIPEEAVAELGRVWGWVLAAGVLSLALGVAALLCPVMTSVVAIGWISLALLVVGAIHVSGLCYAEEGMKCATFAVGVAQIALSIITYRYPFGSLLALTVVVAFVFMSEGLFRISLAMRNRDALLPNSRFILLFNGACNVLFSVIVIVALPFSSLYTIGILVGVNLVTIGTARIALAITAKRASSAGDGEQSAVAAAVAV